MVLWCLFEFELEVIVAAAGSVQRGVLVGVLLRRRKQLYARICK